MTFRPSRPLIRRIRRTTLPTTRIRLVVGTLVVVLFGVDSARLVAERPARSTSPSRGAEAPAQKRPDGSPLPQHAPTATQAVWTTPWIPPVADTGLGTPLVVVLRALPGSQCGNPVGTGSLPAWGVPPQVTDAWRLGLIASALEACPRGQTLLLSCLTGGIPICPMGPPTA